MTDNEIIKALECCFITFCCDECPARAEDCDFKPEEEAYRLVERQREEINWLKEQLRDYMQKTTDLSAACKTQKVETTKECLDWVLSLFPSDKSYTTISRFSVEKKKKEMVGDV